MSKARPRGSGRSGERGAALVQMTIAMLAITAFSTFVMDYGVFWVARRQAQNAADAGALAGAIAVAFGENASPVGAAVLGAQATARANAIWGEPPSVLVGDGLNGTTDVEVEPCPDQPAHPCVRTDVYRTKQTLNPLPTYFGSLAAIYTQDVQASAMAEVKPANESPCLQHWGIADRWTDGELDWERDDAVWSPATDNYIAPNETSAGTGFKVADESGQFCCDYGHEFRLQNRERSLSRFFGRLDGGGGGCEAGGLDDPVKRVRRMLFASTIAAINALVDSDPDACWSTANGCAPQLSTWCPKGCVFSPIHGVNASPRIVQVRVYDPGQVADLGGGSPTSQIVNMVALFLEQHVDATNRELRVRVAVAPGINDHNLPQRTLQASSLRAPVLVR